MTRRRILRVLVVVIGMVAALATPKTAAGATTTPANGQLSGVSCPTRDFCMAVGSLAAPGPAIAYEWDGSSWSLVPTSPLIAGWQRTRLDSVSCVSSTRCVAAGHAWLGQQQILIAERWNGASWRYLAIQRPGHAAVGNIDCTSSTWCMAVGTTSVMLAPGKYSATARAWVLRKGELQLVPADRPYPYTSLSGVACISAAVCTAVGSATRNGKPLIEHWNGIRWREIANEPYPAPGHLYGGGGDLNAISCPSPGTCLAVGTADEVYGPPRMLVESHRNGAPWRYTTVTTPSKYPPVWTDVSCLGSLACGAVAQSPDEQVIIPLFAWRDPQTGRWLFHYSFPDWLYGASCSVGTCTYVGSALTDDYDTGEPVIYRGRGLNPVKQTIPLIPG